MYRRVQFGPGRRMTDGIKKIIIISVAIFFFQAISSPSFRQFIIFNFGIVPADFWSRLHLWQPVTYIFLHGSLAHLALNMLALWMFGTELEMIWGRKQFLKYYFITGAGAGLVTILFQIHSTIPVIGASGAIYGILLAYGLRFPDREAFIFPLPVPIRMKYFVMIFGLIEFFSTISIGMQDGIAHFTHLSGMLIGYIYLRRMGTFRRYRSYRNDLKNLNIDQALNKIRQKINQFKHKKTDKKGPDVRSDDRKELDRILDKISKTGYEGLTAEEKQTLLEASSRLSKRDHRKD
ncbi:rhomboid family intramembrane serine protease [Fidelibacter multiformis]|jgi:membrane associated rhomboid family serine protease|uniref:rhomboid family intramembrane serine protease n=1 Tax=Fidelibacter multiformis TaxID=3377529 RepID=UPI0037DCCB66